MIRIIANTLKCRVALLIPLHMNFCTKQEVPKKTSEITSMFTDKLIEEKKDRPVASGIISLK
jgi:hypothetical protein